MNQIVSLFMFSCGDYEKVKQDPDWETMEKEYMAEKEEKERQAS